MSTTAQQSATIESGRTMPSQSIRTGSSVAELKQAFRALGRLPKVATRQDAYTALALTVRDRVLKQGVLTPRNYAEHNARVVAYLSAKFLPGPHLANNLLSLGLTEPAISEYAANIWKVTPLRLAAADVKERASRSQKVVTTPGAKADMPAAGIQTPPPQPPAPPRIRI